MRQTTIGEARIDAGPTVFTMRWVFDELFDAAGATLGDYLRCARVIGAGAACMGRRRARLDLFADSAASADAIRGFAGAPSPGYLAFAPAPSGFMRAGSALPARRAADAVSLVSRAGLGGVDGC